MSDDRKAYHPAELPEHMKAAIRNAKMAPGNEYLDALMVPPVKPEETAGYKLDHCRDRLARMVR